MALWEEVRAIENPEVRKGLLQRIAQRLARSYRGELRGESLAERMGSVAEMFRQRGIPFEVDARTDLPVLTALACPYPGLAESDRGVCSMERMAISEMLGESMRLTRCRLDGEQCCTFEPASSREIVAKGGVHPPDA